MQKKEEFQMKDSAKLKLKEIRERAKRMIKQANGGDGSFIDLMKDLEKCQKIKTIIEEIDYNLSREIPEEELERKLIVFCTELQKIEEGSDKGA